MGGMEKERISDGRSEVRFKCDYGDTTFQAAHGISSLIGEDPDTACLLLQRRLSDLQIKMLNAHWPGSAFVHRRYQGQGLLRQRLLHGVRG